MKSFRVLSILVCVLCLCSMSVAQDLSFWDDSIFGQTSTVIDNFRLGANVGFMTANENVHSDLAYQGYVEYALNERSALRTTLVYFEAETDDDSAVLSVGDFKMLGVELAVVHTFPEDKVVKYIGAGAGSYMPESEPRYMKTRDDVDSGFGYFVMAGVAVSVGDIVSIDCGAKYLFLRVDDSAEVWMQEVNLDTFFASVGFKWDF